MEDTISTEIFWSKPGHTVQVAGLNGDWSHPIDLAFDPQSQRFQATLPVRPGKQTFKFIVDGMWVPNDEFPMQQDSNGNINNELQIMPHPSEAAGLGELDEKSRGPRLHMQQEPTPMSSPHPPSPDMPEAVHTFKCTGPGHYEPSTCMKEPLGSGMLEIRITHTAFCSGDLFTEHYLQYASGHQGCGIVTKLGPDVTKYRVNDRVACCWGSSTCGYPFTQSMGTIKEGDWCFADSIRIHESEVFRVPSPMPSECVPPLLCAGIVAFSSLLKYAPHPGCCIGVCCLDLIGKMLLQMGRRMGHNMVLLDCPHMEMENARCCGATTIGTPEDHSLDLLFCTMSSQYSNDFSKISNLLCHGGMLIPIGLPMENTVQIPMELIMKNQLTIMPPNKGSAKKAQQMLDFCSLNDLRPETHLMSIDQLNEAVEHAKHMSDKPIVFQMVKNQ